MAPGGQPAPGGSAPTPAPWPILGAPRPRAVVRSLRKEGKLYLWDWGEVPSPDRVSRTWWPVICSRRATTGPTPAKAPSASTTFATMEKEEIDFLVTCDRRPWRQAAEAHFLLGPQQDGPGVDRPPCPRPERAVKKRPDAPARDHEEARRHRGAVRGADASALPAPPP